MKLKFLLALAMLALASCKKNKVEPPDKGIKTPEVIIRNGTDSERIIDSLYAYAQQIYLWNSELPSYEVFNPRQYGLGRTDLDKYNNVLYQITRKPIYSVTGKPYEYNEQNPASAKYSEVSDINMANPQAMAYAPMVKSDVDTEGNGHDVGIKIGAYIISKVSDSYLLFLTAVYPGSPAEKAGLKRSDLIKKINGRSVGVSYNADISFIVGALDANQVTLEGAHLIDGKEGDSFNITLIKQSYYSSPVYKNTVIASGDKKIGYLAYARFSSMDNSQADLNKAFELFNNNAVTDLVIDLRYNGGGYVETAEHLTNLISGTSADGQVMFSKHFNATMQGKKATILKNQPLLDVKNEIQYSGGKIVNYFDHVDYSVDANTKKFTKQDKSLKNIQNVVFIVSGNTASASELVINSLKPYVNVKLVGEKTYGKPVGFFPIILEKRYKVYMSLFSAKNKNGQGDYYEGFKPDVEDSFDDPRFDFGDSRENYLAKAINLINPSVVVAAQAYKPNATMSIQGKTVNMQLLKPMKPIGNGEFIGMIENHIRKIK